MQPDGHSINRQRTRVPQIPWLTQIQWQPISNLSRWMSFVLFMFFFSTICLLREETPGEALYVDSARFSQRICLHRPEAENHHFVCLKQWTCVGPTKLELHAASAWSFTRHLDIPSCWVSDSRGPLALWCHWKISCHYLHSYWFSRQWVSMPCTTVQRATGSKWKWTIGTNLVGNDLLVQLVAWLIGSSGIWWVCLEQACRWFCHSFPPS